MIKQGQVSVRWCHWQSADKPPATVKRRLWKVRGHQRTFAGPSEAS